MKNILLIGLGRFGRHIALQLNKLGHEVMAVDSNEERVNEILYNEDEVSFMNYLAANIICQLHKGEKCVYIRYLKNNYVVIKTDSQIHPVIVSKDCLQRE